MNRKISTVVAVILCLTLTSCSFLGGPERDLERMLRHLSNGNIRRAERYVLEGTLNFRERNLATRNLALAVFDSIDYVIFDSVIVDNVAHVSVTITSIDMREIILEASLEVLGNAPTSRRIHRSINERVAAGNAVHFSYNVLVFMVRDEGRWKVVMSDNELFAHAISGWIPELLIDN